jgi:hypothetical protein
MSNPRPQQASSSHILKQLNVTSATAISEAFHEKLKDADKTLLAEVCKELNIAKDNNDYAALKQMVDDYLVTYLNDKYNYSPGSLNPNGVSIGPASAVVINAYVNYKIQQQITFISTDQDSPLKDKIDLDKIIITTVKKIVRYLDSKGTSREFDNEILRDIFKEELPSVLYILDHCPLISKNETGKYDFTPKMAYYHLAAQLAFDDLPPVSEIDKSLIKAMLTPSWRR